MKAPIVCLGTGRMGQGIAIACARKGRSAVLLDAKPRSHEAHAANREAALAAVRANLDALAEAGDEASRDRQKLLDLITYASVEEEAGRKALAEAEIVFEGVPEKLDVKRDAFAAIWPYLGAETIVASTSSSLLSTTLAELVLEPARFLNAHWLNPAFLIPLVELAAHPGTSPEAFAGTERILAELGKVTVRCAPAPGYIVPRLQTLIMNETARMIEEGVATASDIDLAIRTGFGIRYANMGVAEFIDFGGADILYYASNSLAASLQSDRFACPPVLSRFMEEGRTGLKTGQGFYDWTGVDVHAYRMAFLKRLIEHDRLAAAQRQEEERLESRPVPAPLA